MQRTRQAVTGLGGRAGVLVCWMVLMVLLLTGGHPSIAAADCATQTQIPESECNALMALYTATNGSGWINNTGWDVPENPCGFYGVVCSGGHVTKVYLSYNNLKGSIPSEIGNLNKLTELALSGVGNQLVGSIPPQIGNLVNLTRLNLEINQLSGSIPQEIGNLSSLKSLYFYDNQLSGSIPPQLGNLSQLTTLNLASNQLSGTIPLEIGKLNQLTGLNLGENQLSGTIPLEIGKLNQLTGLSLGGNQLSGSIPIEIGDLYQLESLNLYNNQLIGSIPAEIGNLSQLTGLYLSGNQLSGSIPPEIGSLRKLTIFNLVNNQLSGSIPIEIGDLYQLKVLVLSDNQLIGSIPAEIGNLSQLASLHLDNNQLSGSIPSEIGNLSQLSSLVFYNNQLSGTVPRCVAERGAVASWCEFSSNDASLCLPKTPEYQALGQDWLCGLPLSSSCTPLDESEMLPCGTPPHFVFSAIPANVLLQEPLQVTVTAVDRIGNPITTFNEPVTLTSYAPGMEIVSPPTSANGQTTFTVKFTRSFATNTLHAQATSMHGDSAPFNVGTTTASAQIRGRVIGADGNPAAGALVYMAPSGSINSGGHVTTGADGIFQMENSMPSGFYDFWATHDGEKGSRPYVSIGPGGNTGIEIRIIGKKSPVILVPGMMGSDDKWVKPSVYPTLPKDKPAKASKLQIHDPYEIARLGPGWGRLKKSLKDNDFEFFECPWDWRYGADSPDALGCLLECIRKAKEKTGSKKVHVVAHSMGGLLVRNYIQLSAYASRNDIDRFAMVGTPNHGSMLAYPIWLGGDPIQADQMKEPSLFPYFYSQTLDRLHKKMEGSHAISFSGCPSGVTGSCGGGEPVPEKSRESIKRFLDRNSGVKSLLISDDYCLKQGNTCGKIDSSRENAFLKKLNQDKDVERIREGGMVTTKIFASNSESTISDVEINSMPHISEVYPDGEPQKEFFFVDGYRRAGDGTVTYDSARLEGVAVHPDTAKGEHAGLIGAFREEIIAFIKGNVAAKEAFVKQSIPLDFSTQEAGDLATSELSVHVDNGYAALLTGPDGAKIGIDLQADALYEESGGATVLRNGTDASVSLTDPASGVYTLRLTGETAGQTTITLSWFGAEQPQEIQFSVFYTPPSRTLRFRVDAAAKVFLLDAEISPPLAFNVVKNDSSGTTRLQWQPPAVGVPVSYRVYSMADYQNILTLLDTLPASAQGLTTSHPYGTPRRLYAVSAVDGSGNESILTLVRDNLPLLSATTLPGDVNHDGAVDLTDTILSLQVLSGVTPAATAAGDADVDGDGRIGLQEAIYSLGKAAGL